MYTLTKILKPQFRSSKFRQASGTFGAFLTSCLALETSVIVDRPQTLES
jgi:hypothetical protein